MDDFDGTTTGRSIDIELGGQEVITIDLDNLDPNPEDVLDVLKDGQCKIWVWTKFAGEYWRRGYLDAAEKIAHTAIECTNCLTFRSNGMVGYLPPMYSLLANLQIACARKAPKLILPDARQDILKDERSKEEFYREAALHLNTADRVASESGEGVSPTLAFLTRGIQQLATRSMDDALRSFEGVLAEKPTNVVALLGKARILYARRQYKDALRLFQDVLRYNPQCIPDPRIGVGLCMWSLGDKVKAKAAWERSLEVNPKEWAAQLLLGIESVNSSRGDSVTESERTHAIFYGSKLIEQAFKANQRNAAASNALSGLLLQMGQKVRVCVQADDVRIKTCRANNTIRRYFVNTDEGYLRAGRVSHADGAIAQATKYYTAAAEGQPKHVVAAIGMAQMQLRNDEIPAAIHTLDTLLQPPKPQRSLEATVISDLEQEKARARELFERVYKNLDREDPRPNGDISTRIPNIITEDMDMYAEIARLWQGENIDRMRKALKEALRISESTGQVDPRLLNNLAALQHLEGSYPEARVMYENALTSASTLTADMVEGITTSILYNLARVYEDQGEETLAKDAYDKLLSRHSEYVDAKIRQAQILANLNRHNDAHELLKQCLVSQPNNLNLRAFYTHFLIRANLHRPAKEFVFATLKDHDKHDVYSLCAAGWIQYHQARESRDSSPKAVEERKRGFQRSAEFYEKALQLDPMCAFAAQGLAIVTAEDALGTLGGAFPSPSLLANAREALDIFGKVRESLNDGSVYMNMGHCYYARDEFERAIESYETASMRFYNSHNVPALLCLCRAWYAKATKDQAFQSMNTALRYAQMAFHIQPNDKATMYNIAMIQQKCAEMLFAVPAAKRTLKDLQRVIEQAAHAQKLFASLANDKSSAVPYSRDIADQRRKYGDNMLRKGDEHLATQKQYEAGMQARLEAARKKRQEEKERQEELERQREEERLREAAKVAEERRAAREQAMEWTREVRMESDEEKEKKPKKPRKPKQDGASGDEGEPKKRRRKIRRATSEQGDEEQAAIFSDEEDVERPAKKRTIKKRVVRDEDEDEATGPSRKKQFKSKEMLSDTDEEM
ncbi:RNA polymerase II-associated protein [Cyathus striatus]|nr:RNA polymerase II-associated protein [Cyathus striatus]